MREPTPAFIEAAVLHLETHGMVSTLSGLWEAILEVASAADDATMRDWMFVAERVEWFKTQHAVTLVDKRTGKDKA